MDELIAAVWAYCEACPDDPEVVRFKAALAELRTTIEGLTDGDS